MLSSNAMTIADALLQVKEKMGKSALKAGRVPDDIKLVAVSKTVELERVIQALQAGAFIFGENRVQEARDKISNIKLRAQDSGIEWHLIGNLQKNKVKTAVQLFDLIHSVDSLALAEEINKQAGKKCVLHHVLLLTEIYHIKY